MSRVLLIKNANLYDPEPQGIFLKIFFRQNRKGLYGVLKKNWLR